jgi:O-antigen ligase
MLFIACKPLGVWFPSQGADPDSGSPLDRNFLLGLMVVSFILLTIRRFDWSKAIRENASLILLIGYMFVSVFWSDIPFTSFKRWSRELAVVLMAFLVLSEQDPCEATKSIFRRTAYILIPFSVLLIKYYPEYGIEFNRWSGERMWIGVTTQKNGLGRLCIICVIFLVWSLARRWRGDYVPIGKYQTFADVFILILAFYLLTGGLEYAYSATGITTLATGLAILIVLSWMKKNEIYLGASTLMAIAALVIVFGVVTLFLGGTTVGTFTSTLGRDETLTGRTEIWADLLPIAMQRPIGGSGFGGFWTYSTREIHTISEGHNGYLDILLDLGFVGLLLFSIFIFSCCKKAQKVLTYDHDWGSLCICFLLMALLFNITESTFSSLTTHLTAVLVLLRISSTRAASNDLELRETSDVYPS